MGRLTKPLTLTSLIAVLSATPAIAVSSPSGCRPAGSATLRAYFHRAEFNVTDELGVYLRDLSAYGTPRPSSSASATTRLAARSAQSGSPAGKSVTPKLDLAALRAFVRSGAFDTGDGLVAYGGQ